MTNEIFDVFVSYHSSDLVYAEQLSSELRKKGFNVWFDKNRLQPGFNWHKEIKEGCDKSRVIIPVLTPRWKTSDWTKYETYGAGEIIPVIFEGNWEEVATPPLKQRHFFDHVSMAISSKENWNSLAAAIKKSIDKPHSNREDFLSGVLFLPNPYFTGREKELIMIHEGLHTRPTTALTQVTIHAVTALGGVGKTTLAREYIEKFWRLYPQIFWVDARNDLRNEFGKIYDLIYPDNNTDEKDKPHLALKELGKPGERLIILDNAEDEESVKDWIPKSGSCHTLITSRFAGWSPAIETIKIDVLDKESAQRYLLLRTNVEPSPENIHASDILAKKLGFLPLALEQAAAFIKEEGISVTKYLEFYEKNFQESIKEKSPGFTDYPDSVYTTWKTTISKLSPESIAILRLSAFLSPDKIPTSLFYKNQEIIFRQHSVLNTDSEIRKRLVRYIIDNGKALEEEMKNLNINFFDLIREALKNIFFKKRPEKYHLLISALLDRSMAVSPNDSYVRKALNNLANFSMIKKEQDWFSVHALVQAVERINLSTNEQVIWIEKGIAAILSSSPQNTHHPEKWPLWELLHPHAEELRAHAKNNPDVTINTDFLEKISGFYFGKGLFDKSAEITQEALKYDEIRKGVEHPDIAFRLIDLGEPLRELGMYAEAEKCFRRALEIENKNYGKNSRRYLSSLNYLAIVLENQKKSEEAEKLYRKALSIHNQKEDINYIDICKVLNNLANLLTNKGIYEEAEPLYKKSLDIFEHKLDLKPANLYIITLTNYGKLLEKTKQYDEAENIFLKALNISEKILGHEHTISVRICSFLSSLLLELERVDDAKVYFDKSRPHEIDDIDGDNLNTAEKYHTWAFHLSMFRKYEEAIKFNNKALEIRKNLLGEDHHETARSLNQLGADYVLLGNYEEAEFYLLRAVSISPQFPNPLYWLAKLFQNRNRKGDAEREREIWAKYLQIGPTDDNKKSEAENRILELEGKNNNQ